MIQVDEKETIRRLYFIQRHSIREIARELNHSRKTVRKAITDTSVPEYHIILKRLLEGGWRRTRVRRRSSGIPLPAFI